jgi:hypothetical protein
VAVEARDHTSQDFRIQAPLRKTSATSKLPRKTERYGGTRVTGTWEAQNARIIRDNKTQYFWLRKSHRIIWGPLNLKELLLVCYYNYFDLPVDCRKQFGNVQRSISCKLGNIHVDNCLAAVFRVWQNIHIFRIGLCPRSNMQYKRPWPATV